MTERQGRGEEKEDDDEGGGGEGKFSKAMDESPEVVSIIAVV